jgi:hypothetical protein
LSRRPAAITQAEIQRAIKAAKKEGLPEIKLHLSGQAIIVIPITEEEIIL